MYQQNGSKRKAYLINRNLKRWIASSRSSQVAEITKASQTLAGRATMEQRP